MSPAPVFTAAAASFAANCVLGASVALGLIDTRESRWVHHALYIATVALATGAMSAAAWGRPADVSRQAAAMLAPAAVPLALVPYVGTHTGRHPVVALAAAPFFIAGAIRAARAAGAARAAR